MEKMEEEAENKKVRFLFVTLFVIWTNEESELWMFNQRWLCGVS